jgi:L-iditol 2-dehydrogenase
MKKIVLTDVAQFSVVNAPKPEISSDNDVLIKIAYVGICGSDIHYLRCGRIGDQIIEYPFTLGHECSGIVENIGTKVSRVRIGDRIAIDPAVSCGSCDQCLSGREHTCRNLKFLGNPHEMDGCLQEYIVLPEKCCFKLPENISLKNGIVIEPLTIVLHALGFTGSVENCAILGCGPIGLSTMLALKAYSEKSEFCVTDKIDARLALVQKKGAEWTGNPSQTDVVEAMISLHPLGFDVVFECCGQQEALTQAIELLKPGGQLVIIGIPEEDHIAMNLHKMRRKEIAMQNVRRQNNRYPEAMELLGSDKIDLSGFITHEFPEEQVRDAFDLVSAYADNVMKAVICFNH